MIYSIILNMWKIKINTYFKESMLKINYYKKDKSKNGAIYIFGKYCPFFLSRLPSGCCFKFFGSKHKKFIKLFEEKTYWLYRKMDIIKMVKYSRQLKNGCKINWNIKISRFKIKIKNKIF